MHPLSRRHFLATLATLCTLPRHGIAGVAKGGSFVLEAGHGKQRLDPELPADTRLWTYNGTVPGPLLRVGQGDRLDLTFCNRLDQGSAIHWHGIRIDNAMDGVVGLTQPSVLPGESFEYSFELPDAGTYWYHAHQHSSEQVGRGLYGILVVDEHSPPDIDNDVVIALDDWRLDQDAQIHASFDNLHDIAHGGRSGNWLTVNGEGSGMVTFGSGERLRLRLINAANSLSMPLRLPREKCWLMALDGMPLIEPVIVSKAMTLGPGQRADLFMDCGQAGKTMTLDFLQQDASIPLVRFVHDPERDRTGRKEAPAALPPNPVADCDSGVDASTPLVMRGGAMGDLASAMFEGAMMDIRQLVRHGKAWALNGVVDRTDEPLLTAARGSCQEIVIENRTAWPHAMHLHGHHFVAPAGADISRAGGPAEVLRDTVMVPPGENMPIRFRADNPGRWLLHCHMLEHQAGGMVTWIEVT
jgi:FtsP/CotA-like multicopper oxidase with cupredoxin domain